VSIELSHGLALRAPRDAAKPKRETQRFAASSRSRGDLASEAAPVRRPSSRRPCFLRRSANHRLRVEDARAASSLRLANARGGAERVRRAGAEFQNDARRQRIAIEFFLVDGCRFLSRARRIRDRATV